MGTRGAYGFYKGGVSKITYNHYDSYPTGLGFKLLSEIREYTKEEMEEAFDRIEMVKEGESPDKQQISRCREFLNLDVNTGSPDDWYCLLREAQGSLKAWVVDKIPFMIDYEVFMGDSLMCEWAYVLNFDTYEFEIYQGFQKAPSENRYSKWVRKKDAPYMDVEGGDPYYYWEVKLFEVLGMEKMQKMTHLELKDYLIDIERRCDDDD